MEIVAINSHGVKYFKNEAETTALWGTSIGDILAPEAVKVITPKEAKASRDAHIQMVLKRFFAIFNEAAKNSVILHTSSQLPLVHFRTKGLDEDVQNAIVNALSDAGWETQIMIAHRNVPGRWNWTVKAA